MRKDVTHWTLIWDGSLAITSGTPLKALTFPVTQTRFPLYVVSGLSNFERSLPQMTSIKDAAHFRLRKYDVKQRKVG